MSERLKKTSSETKIEDVESGQRERERNEDSNCVLARAHLNLNLN